MSFTKVSSFLEASSSRLPKSLCLLSSCPVPPLSNRAAVKQMASMRLEPHRAVTIRQSFVLDSSSLFRQQLGGTIENVRSYMHTP